MNSPTPQHQPVPTSEAHDLRCPHCGRLLGRGRVVWFETRCPHCKRIVRLE